MPFNNKEEFSKLKARADKYATDVSKLFSQAVNELLAISTGQELKEGEVFSYSDNPRLAKKATDILRNLHSQTYAAIKSGIAMEWSEANKAADQFLASLFGKNALSDPNLAGWLKRNTDAMDAFFERTRDDGMTLSNRVWNTTKQLRQEMELAMTVSMGEGESAAHISRQVRKYLKEPDRLFRRIKVITADGKEHYKLSKAAKAYHPGRGVYRSSYKNAMRLTRTETNMAYRTADSLRWQQMDFVRGIRIEPSKNHVITDICDDLAGEYPKDFVFTGWHPQCFCVTTPITVDQKTFVEMQKAVLKGETIDTSDMQITEVPDNFVKWCNDNRERIDEAKANGTLPYFLKNNPSYLKQAFSADVLKTDEYKAAQGILDALKDIKDLDTSQLSAAMKKLDLEAITAESAKLQGIIDELNGYEYVDGAFEQAKQWGYEAVKSIEASVKFKVEFLADHYGSQTKHGLEMQKKKLEWEAYTYLGGNMTHKGSGMPVQLKYPAWQVTQNAYIKQIKLLDEKLQWLDVNSYLSNYKLMVGAYKVGNDGYSVLVDKLLSVVSAKDLAASQKLIGEIEDFVGVIEQAEKLQKSLPPKYFNGIKDALAIGNGKKAAEILEQGKGWIDIYDYLDKAQGFVTKSQPYLDLLGEFQQAILDEDADKANEYLQKLKDKRADLDKKAAKRKGGKLGDGAVVFGEECFTQKRKDAAVWIHNPSDANDFFIDEARATWALASKEERKAVWQYTVGSAYITEPLRAAKGYFYKYQYRMQESLEHARMMTDYISRSRVAQDTWIKRDSKITIAGLPFGGSDVISKALAKGDLSSLVGLEGVDESFWSCGSCKNTEFSGTGGDNKFGRCKVTFNIFCPKGTMMTYSEPFNNFGQHGGSWNGKDKPTYTHENEIFLQRGTKFRITKAEYDPKRDKVYIDVEVLSQNPREIIDAVFDYSENGYYFKLKD